MKPIRSLIASLVIGGLSLSASGALLHVGAGNHHSIFLDPETGAVWTVGEDLLGQMGKGMDSPLIKDNPEPFRVKPVWSGRVIDVSAGLNTNAIVTEEGEVWTWGFNRLNQLGHSAGEEVVPEPRRAQGLPPIADVEAGSGFMLAISRDGGVFGWGNNAQGQLGLGDAAPGRIIEPRAALLPEGVRVRDLAVGINQVVALTGDGRVLAWGNNRNGQAGGPEGVRRVTEPAFVGGLPEGVPVAAIGAGNFTSFAILEDGRVFAWGENQFGQIPGASGSSVFAPSEISMPVEGVHPKAISGGARYVHAVLADGRVVAWGVNGPQGQFGTGERARDVTQREEPLLLPETLRLREIHTQTNHTVALTMDGRFVGWGSNAQGRLARADRTDSGALATAFPEPIKIEFLAEATPRD
jgi:alpha-tubulin suppressor-like RCC1 family protein